MLLSLCCWEMAEFCCTKVEFVGYFQVMHEIHVVGHWYILTKMFPMHFVLKPIIRRLKLEIHVSHYLNVFFSSCMYIWLFLLHQKLEMIIHENCKLHTLPVFSLFFPVPVVPSCEVLLFCFRSFWWIVLLKVIFYLFEF